MKHRLIHILLVCAVAATGSGCKKFLNLDPLSNLSGNNFWTTEEDVDNYTNGLFELYRAATFRSNMKSPGGSDEFPFFAFSGDMRFAPVYEPSNSGWGRTYVQFLRTNNLNPIVRGTFGWSGNNWSTIFNTSRFMNWDRLFKVVAGANVLVQEVDGVAVLSDEMKAKYKAEGVFMRNMAYFTMVRLYGDVPYYTNAYNSTPLARTNMIEVLKKCVADMEAHYQNLPWTYNDAARRAVRGMRGGALALMMHMNMWLASFDPGNATDHYTKTVAFGEELINENGGAYELLPYDNGNFRVVFRGRSKEGLFEMPQNSNYGESFGWSYYSDHVTRAFVGGTTTRRNTYLYYAQAFLDEIYPSGEPDIRRSDWYDGIYSTTGEFWLTKYSNIFQTENNATYVDDSQIVFRLGESYLMLAEAYAALSRNEEAITMLNTIRNRARATVYSGPGGDELKEAIWYERCKELIGEGHFSYDMIRTRNVLDPDLSFGNTISPEDFKNGAWTWPLSNAVRNNNPNVTLNNYWN